MALSAVVYATDVASMTAFYAETFDLVRVDGDDEFVELSDGHSALVIHAIRHGVDIDTSEGPRESAAVKISMSVRDIGHACETAALLGGRLHDSGWEWHGLRVYSGVDPEGNVIQAVASEATR